MNSHYIESNGNMIKNQFDRIYKQYLEWGEDLRAFNTVDQDAQDFKNWIKEFSDILIVARGKLQERRSSFYERHQEGIS